MQVDLSSSLFKRGVFRPPLLLLRKLGVRWPGGLAGLPGGIKSFNLSTAANKAQDMEGLLPCPALWLAALSAGVIQL
jgi:hypothetical protein